MDNSDNDPIDLTGNMARMKRKVDASQGDVGRLIEFGLLLARECKRHVMQRVEKEFPDSLAHQCTAAMIAAIVAYRAEEHAALQAPEGSAPHNVWNSMMEILQPGNLGFADEDEANAMDGIKK